jgi:zeta-carotene desaturase
MAAAAALGDAGYRVTLFEARAFLGGRATSYPLAPSAGDPELIDNCQHILLRCCVNLLDFYRRLGVLGHVRFHREFHFIEPGGRVSVLRAGLLPAPLHFAGSFPRLAFLSAGEKLAIARALAALRRQRSRPDLDRITMLDWLREQRQPPWAIQRFWRPVLVSAVNEELDRIAAAHGFQVFWLGFLARPDSYEMGVPAVRLGELYAPQAWRRLESVDIRFRAPVARVLVENELAAAVEVNGTTYRADYCICALPFERASEVLPDLGLDLSDFEHSPITGIHLWFDRPVTELPHAALLDRTIQWMFNKHEGRYVQLVVSASRSLLEMGRQELIALAVGELAEFFPRAREAALEKAHVVKEARATFSARPGLVEKRPPQVTPVPNLFLAGDWTRTGWPATMEGAVRSGYLAAEAVARAAGSPRRFLLPDVG